MKDLCSVFDMHQERLWSGLFNEGQFLCILRRPLKPNSDICAVLLLWSVDVCRLRKPICSAGVTCSCSAQQLLSGKKSPSGETGTWSRLRELFHLLFCQFLLAVAPSPCGCHASPDTVPHSSEAGSSVGSKGGRRCLEHCWPSFLTCVPL